jgi:hypothetical protein
MIVRVVDAKHVKDYRVWLKFNDATEAEVDLASELWGEIFAPLKDPAYFARFRVEETLIWPNGADFAPEFLYELACKAAGRQVHQRS